MIGKFWNWALSLSSAPAPNGCMTGPTPPDPTVVFLMDPVDIFPNGTITQQCTIKSSQSILIPVYAGWADKSEFPNHSDLQLARCARGKYNLGTVEFTIRIDGTTLGPSVVSLSRRPTDPLDLDPIPRSGTIPQGVTEHLSDGFELNVPNNSRKGNRPGGGSPVGSKRAASHGLWVLHSPLSVGPHTINYNVRVGTPPAIGGDQSASAPDIQHPSSANITYSLNVT